MQAATVHRDQYLPKTIESYSWRFAPGPIFAQRAVVTLAPASQRDALQAMLEAGEGLEPIAVEEVAAMVPALRRDYPVAAAIERDAFDMDVAGLHQGFLQMLRRAGGVIALRHKAGRIARRDGAWQAGNHRAGGTDCRGLGKRRQLWLLLPPSRCWLAAVLQAEVQWQQAQLV